MTKTPGAPIPGNAGPEPPVPCPPPRKPRSVGPASSGPPGGPGCLCRALDPGGDIARFGAQRPRKRVLDRCPGRRVVPRARSREHRQLDREPLVHPPPTPRWWPSSQGGDQGAQTHRHPRCTRAAAPSAAAADHPVGVSGPARRGSVVGGRAARRGSAGRLRDRAAPRPDPHEPSRGRRLDGHHAA